MQEHWKVEIYYNDNTVNTQYKIDNVIDNIVIEYDDKSEKEEGLYLNTLDNQELTLDIDNIESVYVNHIKEDGFCDDYHLFWDRS